MQNDAALDRVRERWLDAQQRLLDAEAALREFELSLTGSALLEELLDQGAALRRTRDRAYANYTKQETRLEKAKQARRVQRG